MSGEDAEDGLVVETADGSFYHDYKKGAVEFLEFVVSVGDNALANRQLQQGDKVAVERGLSLLAGHKSDLFQLLAKRINEADPSYFDECTLASIWELFGGIFLVAQHSGFTDSAKVQAKLQVLDANRKVGTAINQKAAEWRNELLSGFIKELEPSPSRRAASKRYANTLLPALRQKIQTYLAANQNENRIPADWPSDATVSAVISRMKPKPKA